MADTSNIISNPKIKRRSLNYPLKYRNIYERAVSGRASPRNAIKAMCIECFGGTASDIHNCTDTGCPLYPYRPYQSLKNAPESPQIE